MADSKEKEVEDYVRESSDINTKLEWVGSTFQKILREAIILLAVLAWNTAATKGIEFLFPSGDDPRAGFAISIIYAITVTLVVLIVLLYSPL